MGSKDSVFGGAVAALFYLSPLFAIVGAYHYYEQQQVTKGNNLRLEAKARAYAEKGYERMSAAEQKAIRAARKEWPSPYALAYGYVPLPTTKDHEYGAECLYCIDVKYGLRREGEPTIDSSQAGVAFLKRSNGTSARSQRFASECLSNPNCINEVIEKNPEDAKLLVMSQINMANNFVARKLASPAYICHALGTSLRDWAYYGVPGASFELASNIVLSCKERPGWRADSVQMEQHRAMAEKSRKAYEANGGQISR